MDRSAVLKSRFCISYIRKPLLERFLRYVKIHTTSDSNTPEDKKPSTDRQFDLARLLADEIREIGVDDVSIDEHACVFARIPATPGYEGCDSIIFNSHLDTSPACSGENVNPKIHENYDGGVIEIGNGIYLDPDQNPSLDFAKGDTIITADGTTLLGADDKCGIAEIMTMLDVVLNHEKIPHGPFEVMFNADEEIGRGTMYFPTDKIKSKIGFSVDGGTEGSYEHINFNAFTVIAKFTGVAAHKGYARGKLVNAISMASSFINMLPRTESPEATDGKYGFYCPRSVKGVCETAKVVLILRDFSMDGINRRIQACKDFGKAIEAMYPGGIVEIIPKYGYSNMDDVIKNHPEIIENVVDAMKRVGIEPRNTLIRGGTDGSSMTINYDIMTPNIFTGSYNFHSKYEWAALGQMIGSVQVLLELVKIYACK